MTSDTISALNALPLAEVRRRALVMQRLSECDQVSLPGAEVVAWQSFSGDHVNWLFLPDGRALLLPFDHECELSMVPEWEVDAQQAMYVGVPDDILSLVKGRPDGVEFLMMGDGSDAVPAASGVCWFDGSQWRASDGLIALASQRGVDPIVDSGLAYCLGWYGLDGEFTADSLIADDAEDRWGATPDDVRALFVEVYGAAGEEPGLQS